MMRFMGSVMIAAAAFGKLGGGLDWLGLCVCVALGLGIYALAGPVGRES